MKVSKEYTILTAPDGALYVYRKCYLHNNGKWCKFVHGGTDSSGYFSSRKEAIKAIEIAEYNKLKELKRLEKRLFRKQNMVRKLIK